MAKKSDNKIINNTFLKNMSVEDIEEKIKNEAYLGILANDETLFNPLTDIPMIARERYDEYLVYLMSKPEYFSFIISTLFNMKSFPLQLLILKEMYEHRFPILIGARGLSKTYTLGMYILIKMINTPGIKCVITGAGFRQAKLVFEVMESIWSKAPMLQNCFKGTKNGPTHGTDAWSFRLGDSICYALPVGHDGSKVRGYRANCVSKDTLIQTDCGLVKIVDYLKMNSYKILNMNNDFEIPDKIYKTNKIDVYKVTTANGYSIKCSSVHRLLVTDGKTTSWKYAKDLTNKDYLELDNNDFFPSEYVNTGGLCVDEKIGFLMGMLISEGTITNRNSIRITHTNKALIDQIRKMFPDFNWSIAEREAKKDPRGWECKKSYDLIYSNTNFRYSLKSLGLDYNDSLKKEIPWAILQSPRSVVIEFLKGLFIGDGSCFKYKSKGKSHIGVSYYSSSELLTDQLQVLLLKFNIICTKTPRYTKLSGNVNYMLAMRGVQAFKIFDIVRNKYWEDNIIKDGFKFDRSLNSRKRGSKFLAETNRCNRNIYLGLHETPAEASDAIKKYLESVRPALPVKSVEMLEEKEQLYDFVMPDTESFLGGGFVNHNCLIADEFASLPRNIFEEVMSGFLSVSADNIQQMRQNAYINTKRAIGLKVFESDKDSGIIQNQLILSGTAYYKHNHFYDYFKKWSNIILSNGDVQKAKAFLPEGSNMDEFSHKDYSVIRIPVELIQSGHMDMTQVNRIKASVSKDVYFREFSACFSDDSDGFFKRSLINSCTLSNNNVIVKSGETIKFNPCIYGQTDKKYVYGIDPAYQGDNFAIVILEIHDTHRRVVHCWTTQASDHKQRLKDGIITENNYYLYCVRKIRDLMKRFPCAYIAMDKGGGGDAIKEAFTDTYRLLPGEEPIYPVIDPTEPPQETDFMAGDHILHIIKFTPEWITQANHALKKDMETRDIIFPYHDSISYAEAEFYNPIIVQATGESSLLYDTLEDCISEIEELKNELSTITISETTTGKEHFDTPEKKSAGMKKGRLKKDRYSALIMANWVARNAENLITRKLNTTENLMEAYFGMQKSESAFLGSGPIAQKLNELYL